MILMNYFILLKNDSIFHILIIFYKKYQKNPNKIIYKKNNYVTYYFIKYFSFIV